jgi:glycosyltransferase involved in cell wall biosynthesis
MILIINASNLRIGGGIQVALSIIRECTNFNSNCYHVFVSPVISAQINQKEFPDNFQFYTIQNTPSSLRHSLSTIHQLRKLENTIKPDCVLSIFGPSYWTPEAPHLLGFAQGYYLYPESPFFNRISVIFAIKINIRKNIHRHLFKCNSNFFYVETEDAKLRLTSFLGNKKENNYVVSNTYNSIFNLPFNRSRILPVKKNNQIRLLTIASYYKHKNLEIINEVASELKKKCTLNFSFVLTINHDIFKKRFIDSKDDIINLGPVPIHLCPNIYHECDFLFLPTLVEIFTASYPEAMKMKKPILTSDLPFAKEICGNAAEYFNPLNPEEIADKIIRLAYNQSRQKELILKGEMRLLEFETPKSRAEKLISICNEISLKL